MIHTVRGVGYRLQRTAGSGRTVSDVTLRVRLTARARRPGRRGSARRRRGDVHGAAVVPGEARRSTAPLVVTSGPVRVELVRTYPARPGAGGQRPDPPGGDVRGHPGLRPGRRSATPSSSTTAATCSRRPTSPTTIHRGTLREPSLLTVGSQGDGPRYRVGRTRSHRTARRLSSRSRSRSWRARSTACLLIAGAVTLVVLATMALLSMVTVRRGLRPLEKIEATAEAIAAGDLSRRVEETDPRTEVGRLGASLNVMLGRIEEAMDERRASEEALRRFLADASHELRTPAHVDPRLRGAVPPRCVGRPRRYRAGDAPDRAGGRADGRARRGSALPGTGRTGTARSRTTRWIWCGSHATRCTTPRAVDPSREIELDAPDALTVSGRRRPAASGPREPPLERADPHAGRNRRSTVRVRDDDGWAETRGERSRPGAHRRRGRARLRAVLPGGSRARSCPRRR